MKSNELKELREELEDEFQRWMDRLPAYINGSEDEYTEAVICLKKFYYSSTIIVQKHVLKSQLRITE